MDNVINPLEAFRSVSKAVNALKQTWLLVRVDTDIIEYGLHWNFFILIIFNLIF